MPGPDLGGRCSRIERASPSPCLPPVVVFSCHYPWLSSSALTLPSVLECSAFLTLRTAGRQVHGECGGSVGWAGQGADMRAESRGGDVLGKEVQRVATPLWQGRALGAFEEEQPCKTTQGTSEQVKMMGIGKDRGLHSFLHKHALKHV